MHFTAQPPVERVTIAHETEQNGWRCGPVIIKHDYRSDTIAFLDGSELTDSQLTTVTPLEESIANGSHLSSRANEEGREYVHERAPSYGNSSNDTRYNTASINFFKRARTIGGVGVIGSGVLFVTNNPELGVGAMATSTAALMLDYFRNVNRGENQLISDVRAVRSALETSALRLPRKAFPATICEQPATWWEKNKVTVTVEMNDEKIDCDVLEVMGWLNGLQLSEQRASYAEPYDDGPAPRYFMFKRGWGVPSDAVQSGFVYHKDPDSTEDVNLQELVAVLPLGQVTRFAMENSSDPDQLWGSLAPYISDATQALELLEQSYAVQQRLKELEQRTGITTPETTAELEHAASEVNAKRTALALETLKIAALAMLQGRQHALQAAREEYALAAQSFINAGNMNHAIELWDDVSVALETNLDPYDKETSKLYYKVAQYLRSTGHLFDGSDNSRSQIYAGLRQQFPSLEF